MGPSGQRDLQENNVRQPGTETSEDLGPPRPEDRPANPFSQGRAGPRPCGEDSSPNRHHLSRPPVDIDNNREDVSEIHPSYVH